jgi:hypothetical protein
VSRSHELTTNKAQHFGLPSSVFGQKKQPTKHSTSVFRLPSSVKKNNQQSFALRSSVFRLRSKKNNQQPNFTLQEKQSVTLNNNTYLINDFGH